MPCDINCAYFLEQLTKINQHPDPARVGKAALNAMQSDTTRPRYRVIERVEQADQVLRRQLSKMLELNDGQTHQFDDGRLIGILSEEITKHANSK